jgi:hypothetical protein
LRASRFDIETESGQDGRRRRCPARDIANLCGQVAPGKQAVLIILDELVNEIPLHLIERAEGIGIDSRRGHALLLACAAGIRICPARSSRTHLPTQHPLPGA